MEATTWILIGVGVLGVIAALIYFGQTG